MVIAPKATDMRGLLLSASWFALNVLLSEEWPELSLRRGIEVAVLGRTIFEYFSDVSRRPPRALGIE